MVDLLQDSCQSCGDDLPAGARFCSSCGTPTARSDTRPREPLAAPVAERRVTSVLFSDIVGFTPLSDRRDAEDVRELLSEYFTQCRTIVARYGGTIEKFICDAVMAVWGVPVAHDDDAETVEADLRAGIAELEAYGAVGYRARAQEELGQWLISRGRGTEATPLLDSARATYEEIGATGLLAHLNRLASTSQALDR